MWLNKMHSEMSNQELLEQLASLAVDISEAEDKATSIREIYASDNTCDPDIINALFNISDDLLKLCTSAWALHTTISDNK